MLLAIAVALGIFLLQAVDPGPEQARIEATNTTTTTLPLEGFGDDLPVGETSVPQSGARPPAEVKVLVVNASGVQGAAGARQRTLTAAGYTSVVTGTAPRQATATSVQHIEGYEPEAQAVAAALSLSPTVVGPVSNPPLVPLADAAVLVVVGTDSKPATSPTSAARATTSVARATTSTSLARAVTSTSSTTGTMP